ncbi:hypothetical protein ES703_65372 [subsurface metagenome]
MSKTAKTTINITKPSNFSGLRGGRNLTKTASSLMMKGMVVKRFAVKQRGIGKPDYSRTVSSSIERRGLKLGFNQTLKVFGLVFTAEASPFAWVCAPLAPGETKHFIDNTTGLVMPFVVPEGYIAFLIAGGESLTQDVVMWARLDGFLAVSMGVIAGGSPHYENRIVGLTTETIDFNASSSHAIDVTLENRGGGNLEGGVDLVGILEAVGTPPLPDTKECRCKFCGHEATTPCDTIKWICPRCDQLNLFYDFTHFRGSR